MCDYCVNHGAGKRWYLSARNYAKDLAFSEYVKGYTTSYFSRDVQPRSFEPEDITKHKKEEIDQYYQMYLHHQVISPKEALDILDLANNQTEGDDRTVVLLPCICRYSIYGSDSKHHCYGIAYTSNYIRKFPKYLGGKHEYVAVETARDKLEKMIHSEDVVHSISALGVPYLGLLCNCDLQVCKPYKTRLHFNIESPFYKGHQRASVNEEKCVACGTCQDICPFSIPEIDENLNVSKIVADTCFGCGICIRNCPENAITYIEYDSSF